MRDSELRNVVLKKFYDLRKENRPYSLRQNDFDDLENCEIFTEEKIDDLCSQLSDKGLIEYNKTLKGGFGRITTSGIDYVEINLN